MNITDPMEALVAAALTRAKIEFYHDWSNLVDTRGLDFVLGKRYGGMPIYIESKQFHSDRIAGQMQRVSNIVVIQGKDAHAFFCELLDAVRVVNRMKDLVTPESELGRVIYGYDNLPTNGIHGTNGTGEK